jgi:hypothetical protein
MKSCRRAVSESKSQDCNRNVRLRKALRTQKPAGEERIRGVIGDTVEVIAEATLWVKTRYNTLRIKLERASNVDFPISETSLN